jgi:uncharacterized protein (DUF924 family)
MITIAIDPSTTRTGIARLDRHVLIETISIKGAPTTDQIREYLTGADQVAVEDQWVGDDEDCDTQQEARAKKQSALLIKEAATRWITVAEVLGIPVIVLHPSTWRSRLKFRRGSSKFYKAQAVAFCKARGWIIHNHDAAEAACIGLVAWLTHSRAQ